MRRCCHFRPKLTPTKTSRLTPKSTSTSPPRCGVCSMDSWRRPHCRDRSCVARKFKLIFNTPGVCVCECVCACIWVCVWRKWDFFCTIFVRWEVDNRNKNSPLLLKKYLFKNSGNKNLGTNWETFQKASKYNFREMFTRWLKTPIYLKLRTSFPPCRVVCCYSLFAKHYWTEMVKWLAESALGWDILGSISAASKLFSS